MINLKYNRAIANYFKIFKIKYKYLLLTYFVLLNPSFFLIANETVFTFEKNIRTTPVYNQYRSNTCWSYTIVAMLETELLNQGKEEIHLSELYIVYYAYIEKAEMYVRMHGKSNFSGGGMLVDPLMLIKKYGIVPIDAYTGLVGNNTLPDHILLEQSLKSYLDELLVKQKIPLNWKTKFIEILNLFMGEPPKYFKYNNIDFTPISFTKYLGINPDNYMLFMSFSYLPYYTNHIVAVPDNWNFVKAYNIPIDEIMQLIDLSINKGYAVSITCDITDDGFMWKKGLAFLFANKSQKELFYADDPEISKVNEIIPDAIFRQNAFDTYENTDDHSLVIVGRAKDFNQRTYYYAKNSWGTQNTAFKGFIYFSSNYLKGKIITLLVNKNVLPSYFYQKLTPNCN